MVPESFEFSNVRNQVLTRVKNNLVLNLVFASFRDLNAVTVVREL